MSTGGSPHDDDVACPDPSVHSQFSRSSDLQNSASKAALLAAEHKQTPQQSKQEVKALGPDGRLSAAGAATSLKYAKATDLPSFPVVGIDTASSGNKAANLANSNQKSFEWWKPEASSNASKAATLANKKGGHVDLWQYKPDGTGNSAAHLAMGTNNSPQLDYGYTEEGHKRALQAATLSIRKKPEPVEEPVPVESYPDAGNASYNALNAASAVARKNRTSNDLSRPSDRATEASRYTHAKGISRDMYGARPPVALEEEEKRHAAALRASAVVMAKALYEIEKPQMQAIGDGDVAARRMHAQQYGAGRAQPSSDPVKAQAVNYLKVQEAAQRLAAERLAKLDPDGVLAYREHYGYGRESQQPVESKSSVRNRERRSRMTKASSDLGSSDDEAHAARIKSQMRGLNSQVAAVDEKKRTSDRANLMAAAQKAVAARMAAMDEQLFNDTGKVSPAMMADWDAKAKAKAAENSEQRMANHGKVHIGGGKYMDQSEVDAIALARLQPTFDEITETAERQHVREAQIKADRERREEEERVEKARQADVKAQAKKLDNDEKARKQAEKDAEKAEKRRVKDEEKEKAREEKEQAKRDKEAMKAHAAEEKAERERQAAKEKELERERAAEAQKQKEIEKAEAEEERERAAAAETAAKKEAETEPVVAPVVVPAAEPMNSSGTDEASAVAARVLAAPVVAEPGADKPVVAEPATATPIEAEPAAEPVVAEGSYEPESSTAAAQRTTMAEEERRSEDVSPGRAPKPLASNPVRPTSPPSSPTSSPTSSPSPTSEKKTGLLERMGWRKSDNKRIPKNIKDFSTDTPEVPTEDRTAPEPDAAAAAAPEGTEPAEAYMSGAGQSSELTARSKGKQKAESVSSISEDEPTRGRASGGSNENWSEAQDKFDDDLAPPKAVGSAESIGGGSERGSTSKFTEDL